MKLFLSHARKDAALARQLADRLMHAGFTLWIPEDEIAPGDNWAKKIGKALEESELMVFLLSPGARDSDRIQQDFEFALFSRKFEGRVFTVFVGPTLEAGKDVPWILLKLPHRQVESASDFGEVVKEIQSLCADKTIPGREQWGDGLRRCAGALADEWSEEDDRILEELHQDRKRDTRREVP